MKKIFFISFFLLLAHYMVLGQCLSVINLSSADNVSSPNIIEKQASITLAASNTINNGAGAIYRSGNDIILNDGFNAVNGSIFQAYIGNCTDYTCPLPKNLTAVVNPDASISLSWSLDSSTTIASWRIQIIPELASDVALDTVYNSSSPYTYVVPPGELSSGANYTFKVNPICDASSGSNYIKTVAFTAPTYKELIWNNRVKLKSWQHNNEYESQYIDSLDAPSEYYSYCPINNFDDNHTLELLGRNAAIGETLKCSYNNGQTDIVANKTGSLLFDTVNYKISDYITGSTTNKTGFKYVLPNPIIPGQPIEFGLYNQMFNSTDSNKYNRLHEVALMFWHWGDVSTENMIDNSGKYSFKRSFTLGEFCNNIIVSFKAKINKSDVDVYTSNSNSFLTADLRFEYYNGSTKVHSGLVGVLFYENNLEHPENPIYWNSYDDSGKIYKLLLRGSSKGIKVCNSDYQDITINYKDFISQLPIPAGLSYDKVMIKGLDIYSHISGKADLNFSIKDVKILGLPSTNANAKNINTGNENFRNIAEEKAFIKISPNPNNGIFKILFNESTNSIIHVTDVLGNIIYNKNFINQKEVEVNLLSYTKGIYFVKVQSGDKIYTEKIILN